MGNYSYFAFCIGNGYFKLTPKLYKRLYQPQNYQVNKIYSIIELGKIMDGWKFYGYINLDYYKLFKNIMKSLTFENNTNISINTKSDESIDLNILNKEKILKNYKLKPFETGLVFYFEDNSTFMVHFDYCQYCKKCENIYIKLNNIELSNCNRCTNFNKCKEFNNRERDSEDDSNESISDDESDPLEDELINHNEEDCYDKRRIDAYINGLEQFGGFNSSIFSLYKKIHTHCELFELLYRKGNFKIFPEDILNEIKNYYVSIERINYRINL